MAGGAKSQAWDEAGFGAHVIAAHPRFEVPASTREGTADGPNYSGVWLSRYVYPSTGRDADFVGEHYVVLRQRGNILKGQSLPHTTGSRLELDLALKGTVVEGNWTEHTSPTGYYSGKAYHGTLQLAVDDSARIMTGQWLGFGKDFKINTGAWELHWVDAATSARATREYALKL